jgi:hypothetical protein
MSHDSIHAPESEQLFETLDDNTLADVHGGYRVSGEGLPSDVRFIMMKESGGRTHVKNPHSSAFGAFQMIKANRKRYMGANWQSTNFNAQYRAASAYVRDRYGSWANARRFWQRNHWY